MAPKSVSPLSARASSRKCTICRGLAATPGARFVGAYDPEMAKSEKIAKKFGGKVFKKLEKLLEDESVHAVHVLTPVPLHVPITRKPLRAGKHVLVEKTGGHVRH